MTHRADLALRKEPRTVDIDIASLVRVIDYLLGGTAGFEVDRTAAVAAFGAVPGGLAGATSIVTSGRDFLARAVRFLAAEGGVSQFLDVGCGLPHPDVTHVAAPAARVLALDDDPIVLAHAHRLRDGDRAGYAPVADIADTRDVLAWAGKWLDLSQPVAVLLGRPVALFGGPAEGAVAELFDALTSGSWLAFTDLVDDDDDAGHLARAARALADATGRPVTPRSMTDVTRLLDGFDVAEPGVVPAWRWRPGGDEPSPPCPSTLYAAVARKPHPRQGRRDR